MSLHKVGFWAVSITAFIVSFLITIDHLTSQNFIPLSAKFAVITWGIILVSITITMKLLWVFERMNIQMEFLKRTLEQANPALARIQPVDSNSLEMKKHGGADNIIPFSGRAGKLKSGVANQTQLIPSKINIP